MPLQWIFFDAGNTLIGLDYGLLLAALAREGFAIDEPALRRAELSARRELDQVILRRFHEGPLPRTGWVEAEVWLRFWRQVLEACGATPYDADALVAAALRVTRPASSWDRVESTTVPALRALAAAGYRLGVISNSSGGLADHLRRLGLADHFEMILDSHHVGVEKPHPAIFQLALRQAGLTDAAGALYVGDVYAIDVLGAASAGMHALLFDPLGMWDPGLLPAGAPSCRTLRSIAELPVMLMGQGEGTG